MDQSTLDTLSYLPLVLFVFLGFICWVGSWRRVVILWVFVFSAVIIALQHNTFITKVISSQIRVTSMSYFELSALVFVVMITGVFVGLYAIFIMMWRPKPDIEKKYDNFGANLLRGMLGGIVGAVLGVMLLMGLLGYMQSSDFSSPIRSLDSGVYADIVIEITERTISFAQPWIPGELPRWATR